MRKVILIALFTVIGLAPEAIGHGEANRSPSVVAGVFGRHEASLAYAYESSFKTRESRLAVKVVVLFDITAEGDVENVEIVSTDGFDALPDGPALSAMFVEKVTEAIYAWRFYQVSAGTVTVETPFVFVPDSGEAGGSEDEGTETPSNGRLDYHAGVAERTKEGIYRYDERVIKCRREKPVSVETARSIPDGDIFEKAAKADAEKPTREFLKDAGKYFDERREPAAAKLTKKLARKERELAEVEAALAEGELHAAVNNLGLSSGYDRKAEVSADKKAKKLREKRERLSAEIEKLNREISTAEETRSRLLAEERTALIARGEGLPKEPPPSGGGLWITLALAELYLDGGEAAKAAPLFREVSENGEGEIVAEALYGLAQSYLATGDEENAALALLQLTAADPNSPYVAESDFRLGEYCASISKPVEAGEYYGLAAASDGPYRDVARYRAGWTYYECSSPLGEEYYDRAVTTFKSFLDGADESSPYWDHAVEMTGLCLAEWEPDAADALARYGEVFRGTDERPYAADVLRAMGDAYLYRMDRLPEAEATYEVFLRDYPNNRSALAALDNLIKTHLNREDYDDAHAARIRLVDEYGPASNWYWSQDDAGQYRALLRWDTALYEVAVYYNMLAERKTRIAPEDAQPLFGNAIDRYNQYLTTFPTNEKAYHINFYFAEVYYALGDFENAAQQYIKTAIYYTDRERYKIDRWDDKFTQEQSYFNAIVARDEIFQKELENEDKSGDGLSTSERVSPRPLTEAELNVVETCLGFLNRYPESGEVPTILSKTGEVYFGTGDYERAREYYVRLVDECPQPLNYKYGKQHDTLYVHALIAIAMAYSREAKALAESGNANAADEKRAEAEAWLERARAEAEKRKVDFEKFLGYFE